MKKITLLLGFIVASLCSYSNPIERVILFTIDGLHWEAPSKLKMPNFNNLSKDGVYIKQSYVITPHHPTTGEYGRQQSCSFPNPVLHQGTVFVSPQNKFIQEMWQNPAQTAFVANSKAYMSVSRGFSTAIQDASLSDEEVVLKSLDVLKTQDIKFMRIHLQTAGNDGYALSYTTEDKPYYRNIYGKNSPYVKTVEEADKLLGKLIKFLQDENMWSSTLLVVTSDHGESKIGWHPIVDPDSWRTPLLFVGPTIAKGRELSYFEHTDLAPTICGLMGVKPPSTDGGAGKFITHILEKEDASTYNHPQYIKTINKQINDYNKMRSQFFSLSETNYYFSNLISFLENSLLTPEPFYGQDSFTEWKKAGNTEHLIEANSKILKQMKAEIKKAE